MVSDDTEHTVFVAQCLAESPHDPEEFQRKLAWKLRLWLLGIPAGIGFATLRAILKLWLGFSPSRSGVFSAGNGPAMRSAIIGAYFATDPERLQDYVNASTRLTHTDPKAEVAALAVALTAAWSASSNQTLESALPVLRRLWVDAGSCDLRWKENIETLFPTHENGGSVQQFAAELGLARGVTGYAYHSVPVALYAWLHHFGDFRATLEAVFDCGGDADTVGAIAGALAAIRSSIPMDWIEPLCDFPISKNYLHQLGQALENKTLPPLFPWVFVPFRNLLFLLIVLIHGFRRLVPA